MCLFKKNLYFTCVVAIYSLVKLVHNFKDLKFKYLNFVQRKNNGVEKQAVIFFSSKHQNYDVSHTVIRKWEGLRSAGRVPTAGKVPVRKLPVVN